MRVLHLVAGELTGGAARGAYWLHRGLMEIGVDSHLLTNGRETYGDPTVTSLCKTLADKVKFSLSSRLANLPVTLYPKRQGFIYNTGIFGINYTKHPLYESADIIHLHWINGLVSMHSLKNVKKPIIWTMRDMWPMTGGCHYAMDCDRYTTGCGRCPQLGSSWSQDLSRWGVQYKRRVLSTTIKLVGISHWLSDCAEKSHVFQGFDVSTISNNIDTSQFAPVEKHAAKHLLAIYTGRRIVLVGANNVNDFYKGFSLFCDAVKYMNSKDIHLMVLGSSDKKMLDKLGLEYTALGRMTDTIALRLVYSAADVFVAPSRMDAFGKTLAESMSCGTPVVCFDATGPTDIVTHKESGYKAKAFDPEDLARGIKWVLSLSSHEYAEMSKVARTRAVEQFDSSVVAQQYKELYANVMC